MTPQGTRHTRHIRRFAGGMFLGVVLASAACAPEPARTAAPGPSAVGPASSVPDVSPTPVRPAPSTATVPKSTTNVQPKGSRLVVRSTPDAGAEVITTLGPTTELGARTTLLVEESRPGWFRVALPIRPNGLTGWVEAADVTERANTFSVVVDLAARRLVVRDGDRVVVESAVAIGAEETATPTGEFFVTDLLENDDPRGAYGPFAIGLSAHSETITEFAGGDGRIGIHGTNDPTSIGRAVSHGCIRVPNDVIVQLADLLPLGTPVRIV